MEQIIAFDNRWDLNYLWSPLSDQIRGGNSTISMEAPHDQTARIFGELKLNNQNAGFASMRVLRQNGKLWNLQKTTGLNILSRGDGRIYKLLVKDLVAKSSSAEYSWQAEILTTTHFQITNVRFSDFKPVYRGRSIQSNLSLDLSQIVEFGFQINDKKVGPFEFILKSVVAV